MDGGIGPGTPPHGEQQICSHVLPCSKCGYATKVIDTRPARGWPVAATRRRRACLRCEHRDTTYEWVTSPPNEEVLEAASRLMSLPEDIRRSMLTLIWRLERQ